MIDNWGMFMHTGCIYFSMLVQEKQIAQYIKTALTQ